MLRCNTCCCKFDTQKEYEKHFNRNQRCMDVLLSQGMSTPSIDEEDSTLAVIGAGLIGLGLGLALSRDDDDTASSRSSSDDDDDMLGGGGSFGGGGASGDW